MEGILISINKKGLIILFFLLLFFHSKGQDIQFSQFYTNVIYSNPAFTGSAHGLRGIAHQRIQWPQLDAKYTSSLISVDNYFKKFGNGVGIMVWKDWQGTNNIASTEVALTYAHEIHLSHTFSMRLGFKGAYVNRNLNYSILTFPDQYTDNGFQNSNTVEPFGDQRVEFADFSAGGMLYSKSFWMGISAFHINTPNQSFYGSNDQLPLRMGIMMGHKINLNKVEHHSDLHPEKDIHITPSAYYKFQGKSDQLDIGVYGQYDYLLGGVWYRGIPLIKQYEKNLQNNESITLLVGAKVKTFSITYSYDFTVSKLTAARTGGAHEINITYVYKHEPHLRKYYKRLPCPNFMH